MTASANRREAKDARRRAPSVATRSPDVIGDRVEILREMLPEVFSETSLNIERLRGALGELVDGGAERYAFGWAGRREATQLLATPSRATLTPNGEESLGFDNTSNLFLEGDNLEVLKLLYKAYFGRVRMIYIDPPYNTGSDFVYPDDYSDPMSTYLRITEQADESGNLLTSNPETSGRYHSSWLSMMYPRLFLARQLLREDGVIWISIDDIEVANLRLICNEIFGDENFVATFIWEKRTTRENRRVFSFNHDYILCYAKDKQRFQASRGLLPLSEAALKRYSNPDDDPRGDWQSVSLNVQAGHATAEQFYTIETPAGRQLDPPPGRAWSVTRERLEGMIADNRVWFGEHGRNVPREKVFLSEAREGLTPHTLWTAREVGTNDAAKKALIELFDGQAVYETPKPVSLIRRMLSISTAPSDNDLVLDFFAGSCTTAQAVLEANREDGGNRRYIVVQLPEPTPQGSAARAAGYETVADIGKEVIRRVGTALDKNTSTTLAAAATAASEDHGVRVFKLERSNYRLWTGVAHDDPETYGNELALFSDPLVGEWQAESVIWEVAIKEGFSLSSRLERLAEIAQNAVWRVTDESKNQSFLVCLDATLKASTIKALPLGNEDLFVCLDDALTDEMAANLALQARLKTI